MLLLFALVVAAVWAVGLVTHVSSDFMNFLLAWAIILAVAHFMGRRSHTI